MARFLLLAKRLAGIGFQEMARYFGGLGVLGGVGGKHAGNTRL